MPRFLRRRWTERADERGLAMVTVMLVILVVTAFASMVTYVAANGLHRAAQDESAAAAGAISDAGVAEALAYIRSHNPGSFTVLTGASSSSSPGCPETSPSGAYGGCTSNPWTDPTAPQTVAGGQVSTSGSCGSSSCYLVWIGTVQNYVPASGQPGQPGATPAQPAVLDINSLGYAGVGQAAHKVTAQVTVQPESFPFGVFGNQFSMNSSHPPAGESMFINGDATLKCPPTGVDLAYNIPAAVHATGSITYATGGSCPTSRPSGTAPVDCQTSGGTPIDPFDQDGAGEDFASTSPCYNYDQNSAYPYSTYNLAPYSQSSEFDKNKLAAYGYLPLGLPGAVYSQLKSTAISEGTYDADQNPGGYLAALQKLVDEGVTNPVVYIDDGYSLSEGDLAATTASGAYAFFRALSSSSTINSSGCTPYSLTIVVLNGGSIGVWNGLPSSPNPLIAAIFVPQGSFTADGNFALIGTLFSESLDFEGKANISLDQCFAANPPSGVTDAEVTNYQVSNVGNPGLRP